MLCFSIESTSPNLDAQPLRNDGFETVSHLFSERSRTCSDRPRSGNEVSAVFVLLPSTEYYGDSQVPARNRIV